MIVGFFIFVIIVALVAGFFLGRRREEAIVSNDIIEKINFAMGTENKSLKEENETLRKKNLFFSDWFIRSYIEQYYRKKLALDDHQIYTVDALENFILRDDDRHSPTGVGHLGLLTESLSTDHRVGGSGQKTAFTAGYLAERIGVQPHILDKGGKEREGNVGPEDGGHLPVQVEDGFGISHHHGLSAAVVEVGFTP
jgi:hypothetical protein